MSDTETTNRLRRAKAAFSTRRVPVAGFDARLVQDRTPKPGDLMLARIDTLGSHKTIELPTGRRAQLFTGDEIILAYGNRYAPDQYEAYVPTDLGPCHMVAAGGIAGRAECWHGKMSGPTSITPIGLVGAERSDGQIYPVNLADFALPIQMRPLDREGSLPLLAVFGTSMNAGKTTTAAGIVKGLARTGLKVGALKITGTAAGGDLWLMSDSGAAEVLDFTDAGYATTFGVDAAEILKSGRNLVAELAARGCDVIVIEVADGLYQRETARIAADPDFTRSLAGTFFAAGDAMGAVEGTAKLRSLGHRILSVSGAFTCSPLAVREAREAADLPVATLAELIELEFATRILDLRPVCHETAV